MSPKEFNKAMGAVIRRHRKERKLSQTAVGAVIGVTYQQMQKSEAGINGFSAHYLPKLAEFFGVPVGSLFSEAAEEGTKPCNT